MKEIGKLIELLNEYSVKEKFGIIWKIGDDPTGIYGYVNDMYGLGWASDLVICSARYGFIKWLVENDKIELEAGPLYGCQLIMHNRQPYTLYETILMLLAIEENPISLLISILK